MGKVQLRSLSLGFIFTIESEKLELRFLIFFLSQRSLSWDLKENLESGELELGLPNF
jgi:hypothetical protein